MMIHQGTWEWAKYHILVRKVIALWLKKTKQSNTKLKTFYLIIEGQKAVVTTDFLEVVFVRLTPNASQFISKEDKLNEKW